MHARYDLANNSDEYEGHRALQAFSLTQFVKHTSKSCNAVIVAGDMNSMPWELSYQVIRSNALLEDAWLLKVSYTSDYVLQMLDYKPQILYCQSKYIPTSQ